MPPPSPLLLPHQPAAAAAAMNLDHHLGPPPPRRRDDADHLHLLLPSPDDLIPLHQSLITPDLALAFDIPAPSPPPAAAAALPEPSPDEQARTLKRPRLVWTPQLHKRFVDAVLHLGIKNAVPKTIMQLMSVDGLTRENVASHLQKYRLYLKRMQGMSHGAPSAPADALTEQLFATVPVPPRFLARDQFPPFLQVGNLPRHHHHHLHPSYYHPQQQVGPPPAASFEFGFARHHQQQGGEKKALPLFPNSP